jgi:hypothetical protein
MGRRIGWFPPTGTSRPHHSRTRTLRILPRDRGPARGPPGDRRPVATAIPGQPNGGASPGRTSGAPSGKSLRCRHRADRSGDSGPEPAGRRALDHPFTRRYPPGQSHARPPGLADRRTPGRRTRGATSLAPAISGRRSGGCVLRRSGRGGVRDRLSRPCPDRAPSRPSRRSKGERPPDGPRPRPRRGGACSKARTPNPPRTAGLPAVGRGAVRGSVGVPRFLRPDPGGFREHGRRMVRGTSPLPRPLSVPGGELDRDDRPMAPRGTAPVAGRRPDPRFGSVQRVHREGVRGPLRGGRHLTPELPRLRGSRGKAG